MFRQRRKRAGSAEAMLMPEGGVVGGRQEVRCAVKPETGHVAHPKNGEQGSLHTSFSFSHVSAVSHSSVTEPSNAQQGTVETAKTCSVMMNAMILMILTYEEIS